MSPAPTEPDRNNAFAAPSATWDQRFDRDDFLFGTRPNAFLQQHAGVWPAGARVLCVADGEGRNSVWLARQGLQVEAFDVSPVGVAKARAFAAREGVHVDYHVSSTDDWPWDAEAMDGVAAIFVQFADPAMRRRLFAGIARTLRPGGTLLLQGYTPRQLEYRTGGPGRLDHLYTADQLRADLGSLEIEQLIEYEADLAEGDGHHGRSALVGVIARKP